jgi:hypothetical protein
MCSEFWHENHSKDAKFKIRRDDNTQVKFVGKKYAKSMEWATSFLYLMTELNILLVKRKLFTKGPIL